MRKHLGIVASLLLLSAMGFFWTGCSDRWNCCDYNYGDSYGDSYGPVSEATYQSQAPRQDSCDPCGEPACKPRIKCVHPSSNELCCVDGITVRAKNPHMCMLGDQYPLEFQVSACDDVCDVVIHTELPDGVSFVRSEPQARVEGRRLTWEFGHMSKGECINTTVWLECQCEGEQCVCFCGTATPVRFCSVLCAKPILTCEKCGPKEVCPGDSINYTITVFNRGSCAAEDVVVTDNLPQGITHESGLNTLTFKLGCLEPCESKTINICARACTRGVVCNTAVVSACNADSVSCEWCTCVCCCDVAIEKDGPKEVPAGKNADYQIVVSNTGDVVLTGVVVTDCAPASTTIVSAEGAEICGNEAVWRLPELGIGEKATFNITLTTCTPGCFTDRARVDTCQGCTACTEFTTRWRGRPALTFCITDTEDPICVGEPTSYLITLTNQGSEPDDNVRVVVKFPAELTPVGALGDVRGVVNGNVVEFEPVDNFGPRQTLKLRVDARGKQSGDGRVIVEVTSASIATPIVQQESTIVQ